MNRAVEEFNGRLDIFIANSGIPWTVGSLLDGDLEHYRKVVDTNVDGTFYCARAAGRHWRRQRKEGTTIHGEKLENYSSGAFVATASMSGHIVNIPQMQSVYNTTKAAVLHLCKSTLFAPILDEWMVLTLQRQISGCRMGGFCSCQFCLPGVHCYRDHDFRSRGDEESLEGEDPHGP